MFLSCPQHTLPVKKKKNLKHDFAHQPVNMKKVFVVEEEHTILACLCNSSMHFSVDSSNAKT